MRVLLVAAALCVGGNAWGEKTKVTLWSADFESGVAGDYWKNGSDYILASGRHGGTVAGVKSSSDRGAFMPTTCDWTDVDDYTIELDFYPCTNNTRGHDFAVVGESSFDSWTWNYGFFYKMPVVITPQVESSSFSSSIRQPPCRYFNRRFEFS